MYSYFFIKTQEKPQHLPSYQNKTKYHQKVKGLSSTLKGESDLTRTKNLKVDLGTQVTKLMSYRK